MQINYNQLDEQQKTIKGLIDSFLSLANIQCSWFDKVKRFFGFGHITDHIPNIYLYGKVGRGKTMLMQYYYDQLTSHKKMVHFQGFIKEIHEKLHVLREKKMPLEKIINKIACDFSKDFYVLCLDEFEINDIADAMLILRLFRAFEKYKIKLFITTNTPPEQLYKDGLQRAAFLPFIDSIRKEFKVLSLNQEHDYRYIGDIKEQRVFAPATIDDKKMLQKIKRDLIGSAVIEPTSVKIFNRKLLFARSANGVIFTDFDELFTRQLGYADYRQITKEYKIFVVEKLRKISEDETDIILRFIHFIDNAYYNKILLFVESEYGLDELYSKGKKSNEFIRSLSRLHEMNSAQYQPITNNEKER